MNKKDKKKINQFAAKHRLKDLISVLEELRDKKEAVHKHFYFGKDPFWVAFRTYLEAHPTKLLEPPRDSDGEKCKQLIISHSSGPVHFREAWAMSPGCFVRKRKDGSYGGGIDWSLAFFSLRVEVVWHDPAADFDNNCKTKEYGFSVPYDLFRKFTKKKFDLWVKKESKEFLAERKEEAKKTLKAIQSEFPDLVPK